MKFSYRWLSSFFKKKLPPPHLLGELLQEHSFEVKKIEKKGKDFILDLDILPNRVPDSCSHLGIAREIGAILKRKIVLPRGEFEQEKEKASTQLDLKIEAKKALLRYTARVIFDVKVKPSPDFLKERLENCGICPVNNIVDITNYVMLETGQPLHAFDFDKISQNQKGKREIVVRFAKKGEKILALDEKEYLLSKDILLIGDPKKPLAIAGIKGGKIAQISQNTKRVVLESATFEPKTIRKGSQKLNLKTDASLRFEHGLDPNLAKIALERASYLISKFAQGKILKGVLDYYPKKVFPQKINLKIDKVEKLLGIKIPQSKIKKILESLEFEVKIQKEILRVKIPTFRRDICREEDLIEEIGRLFGYNKIPSKMPSFAFLFPKKNEKIFWENFVKKTLKELGFVEVYNYSFWSPQIKKIFGSKFALLKLQNPISENQKYLRGALLPNLLLNLAQNLKNLERKEIKIFELGKIFYQQKGPKEKKALTCLLWQKDGEGFFILKGFLESLFFSMGIADFWFDDYKVFPQMTPLSIWHPKKRAEIKIRNLKIGFLGEISKKILEPLKIKGKVWIFDLDFDLLWKLAREEKEYQPPSPYPSAVRDLAILVPRFTKVVEVLNVINRAGGQYVQDVDLFDIYEGEELPEGKKNLAFHIIYQAKDRTLLSEEIDKIHQKIIKALEEENLEWQVRK